MSGAVAQAPAAPVTPGDLSSAVASLPPSLDAAMEKFKATTEPGQDLSTVQDTPTEKPKPQEKSTKKGIDRLEELKPKLEVRDTVEKKAETKTVQDDDESAPTDQRAWTSTKKERNELRKWREAMEPKLAQFEKDIAERDQKLADFEKKYGPDHEKEYQELKKFRSVWDVANSPEFDEKIAKPMDANFTGLADICTDLKLDFSKLLQIADGEFKTNRQRAIAIEDYLNTSEEQVRPSDITDVLRHVGELKEIAAERDRILNEAETGKAKLESDRMLAEQQESQKWDKEIADARENMFKRLHPVFADVLKDGSEELKTVQGSAVAETPEELALHAMAYELVPIITNRMRAAEAKLAEIEKKEKAALGTRPGLHASTPKPTNGNGSDHGSLEQAMAAHMRGQ